MATRADVPSTPDVLQRLAPMRDHAPGRHRPLGGYLTLMGTFGTLAGGYARWFHASGRELPERVDPRDLALLAVAAHKAARLIAKDRVASGLRAPFTRYQRDGGPGEVEEAARGEGLRRAVGELVVCPYCLGMWLSAGFTGGLLAAPRATRWTASVLATATLADALQLLHCRLAE